jgi:integrase
MTRDDVRRVLDAARSVGPAAELALRIAAVAGARRAEIAALQWSDLDGRELSIDSSIVTHRDPQRRGTPMLIDAPTKTGSGRSCHVDDLTAAMIVRQRADRGDVSTYMFSTTSQPPSPDRIGWWWQRARALAAIDEKWRLHDLRHWSATTAIANGADLRTVATRLGHADPAMTLRVYAHSVKCADDALADVLADALGS